MYDTDGNTMNQQVSLERKITKPAYHLIRELLEDMGTRVTILEPTEYKYSSAREHEYDNWGDFVDGMANTWNDDTPLRLLIPHACENDRHGYDSISEIAAYRYFNKNYEGAIVDAGYSSIDRACLDLSAVTWEHLGLDSDQVAENGHYWAASTVLCDDIYTITENGYLEIETHEIEYEQLASALDSYLIWEIGNELGETSERLKDAWNDLDPDEQKERFYSALDGVNDDGTDRIYPRYDDLSSIDFETDSTCGEYGYVLLVGRIKDTLMEPVVKSIATELDTADTAYRALAADYQDARYSESLGGTPVNSDQVESVIDSADKLAELVTELTKVLGTFTAPADNGEVTV